ncbi:MAG: divergent polysaccharide deacetylase family protein, partial [Pseudomonadota bacterium]|nr:divergent polysaccharide deacetylase family protein [Pseudomonadota bacterium]
MEELKEDRPQITIQVRPKRRVIEPPLTEKKPAADKPAEVISVSVSDQKLGAPTTDQMNPHPDEKLVEQSNQGPLPKIDEAGRQAWRVYAGPFDKSDTRPRIAVVVTYLGLSPQLTQRAITELPGQITLGFAPYARSLGDWIQQARD